MIPRILIDRTSPIATSQLHVGVTLNQVTPAETWEGTAESRARANAHVEAMRGAWFVQHLGTWGIDLNKVWPKPSVIDWVPFDRRFQWMVDRGLENVVIVCYGAPDWATVPSKNPSYRQLLAEYEEPWASFCVLALKRAITLGVNVKVATCWNELKGDGTYGGDWDIKTYTRRYNAWYRAIRNEPDLDSIALAGPYLILENAQPGDPVITQRNLATLEYWYANAIDADIIAVDHALAHKGTAPLTQLEYMQGTPVYGSIIGQLRRHYPSQSISMQEAYPMSDTRLYAGLDVDFQAAWYASLLCHLALAGCSYSFSWGLTGDGKYAPGGCIASWLTDTRALTLEGAVTDTGILPGDATPLYHVYKLFHEHFGAGRPLYDAMCDDPLVEVLASDSATLIINKHDYPVTLRLGYQDIHLGRYELKLLPEPVEMPIEERMARIAREECGQVAADLLGVMRDERERVARALETTAVQIRGGPS